MWIYFDETTKTWGDAQELQVLFVPNHRMEWFANLSDSRRWTYVMRGPNHTFLELILAHQLYNPRGGE